MGTSVPGDMFSALVEGRLPPGTKLDRRFIIGPMLGKGGVGLVYRATDQILEEEVVLKFLNPVLASDPKIVGRFKREIRVCRKITHPNVIRIYDIGELCGTLAISMELVEGKTLKALLKERGVFSEQEAAPLVRGLLEGLGAAHRIGVVHRDLKSLNVMVDEEGNTKILDFGMARLQDADHLTQRGDILGSPAYMSPEQAQGLEVDNRTDIYALGIILFEMLTGELPFRGQHPLETVSMQIEADPPSPKSLAPGISSRFESLILRCLEKEPAQRFQNVEEILDKLGHQASVVGPAQRPVEAWHEALPTPFTPLEDAVVGCLVGCVAVESCVPLSPILQEFLELAVLQCNGRPMLPRKLWSQRGSGDTYGSGGQLWAILPALRQFSNRPRLRSSVQELLSRAERKELIMGHFVAEITAFLLRRCSGGGNEERSLEEALLALLPRLRRTFGREAWLQNWLELIEAGKGVDVLDSGQPGLAAFALLAHPEMQSPSLDTYLQTLGHQECLPESWRRLAGHLIGAWQGLWNGPLSLGEERIKDQPACAVAWDLGLRIVPRELEKDPPTRPQPAPGDLHAGIRT